MMRQKRLNRPSGKGRFAPFRVLSLVAWTGLVAYLASPAAWGLARWPDNNNALPDNDRRAKAVVRILPINQGWPLGVGSGVVIGSRRDARGNGWLCVLTAAHVVAGADAAWIGFDNIQRDQPFGVNWRFDTNVIFRHPRDVDLAILGVRVDNLDGILRDMTVPSLPIAAPQEGASVIMAGFGMWAVPDRWDNRRRYIEPPEDNQRDPYGTYRSGTDRIHQRRVDTTRTERGVWTQQILSFHLEFRGEGWPPDEGDACLFPGDSGGPSFMQSGESWLLVGIHTGGKAAQENGRWYANAGITSADVDVSFYRGWIERTCRIVPEPASVIALAVGLMGLAYGRRRRAA